MKILQRRRDGSKKIVLEIKSKVEELLAADEEITPELQEEITATRTLMKEKETTLKEL